MSSSDIKAGGAYVEIGGKSDAFEKAMDNVSKKFKETMKGIHAFGSALATGGAAIAAFGGAMIAPLAKGVTSFAEFGAEIQKSHAKTGMDTDFIQALKHMADETGVSTNAVTKGIVTMERNISNSNARASEAIESIGLSFDEIKKLRPEDQYDAMTTALAGVADEGQRAAAAQAIFGGAGMQMLPMLEKGSEALREAAENAKKLNSSISPEAAARALDLQQAFKRLEESSSGLSHQIGDALYPVIKPIVDRVVDLTAAGSQWIQQNPELIQTFAKGAVEVAALGTALLAAGGAIMAISSPAFVATGAVLLLISAVGAVSDLVGGSDLGFGELFNSVRIGGVGLGTGLTEIALTVEQIWISVAAKIGEAFRKVDTMVNAEKYGAEAYDKEQGANLARSMAKDAGKRGDAASKEKYENQANAFDKEASVFRSKQSGTYDDGIANEAKIQAEAAQKLAEVKAKMDDLFKADYKDTGEAFGFDADKAKTSVLKIFDNVWNEVGAQLTGVLDKVPKLDFNKIAPQQEKGGGGPGGQDTKYSTSGTFNAAGVAGLGGDGIYRQILDEAKKQTALQERTEQNTRAQNGGGTFSGSAM